MRKLWALFLALCMVTGSSTSLAATTPPIKADDIYIPIGKKGQQISLWELSQISISRLEALRGKHMGWIDKVGFRVAQRGLRRSIHSDGTFDAKKLDRFARRVNGEEDFHTGGFLLGFFLLWAGVLVAYLFEDDKRKRRFKCACIGFAVSAVLTVSFVLYVMTSLPA